MNEILSSPRIDFQLHPHRSARDKCLQRERERERGCASFAQDFPTERFQDKEPGETGGRETNRIRIDSTGCTRHAKCFHRMNTLANTHTQHTHTLLLSVCSGRKCRLTAINSFRCFLDNRGTFNREHCSTPSYRSSDSTLISRGFYTAVPLGKTVSLSNEQTLSPSRELPERTLSMGLICQPPFSLLIFFFLDEQSWVWFRWRARERERERVWCEYGKNLENDFEE